MTDFSLLSQWGARRQPFVALIDFEGGLVCAEVVDDAIKEGRVTTPIGVLCYRMNCASQYDGVAMDFRSPPSASGIAMDFHSTPPWRIVEPAPKDVIVTTILRLQQELTAGKSYLMNYCSQTEIATNYSVQQLFENSNAPFNFWLEGHFLSFSPEAFIAVEGDTVSTMPMKGTGVNPTALLLDAKEAAEHATVVDLLRNDLNRIASRVRVEKYRYVTEIQRSGESALFQTSSCIAGKMPPDWRSRIGEWLPLLLPAGSVTGAPKRETVRLIKTHESMPRGFFTGVAVLFDGENLTSAVLIRFVDLTGDRLFFRSGAGVTVYSDPEKEYEEILSKVYFPI